MLAEPGLRTYASRGRGTTAVDLTANTTNTTTTNTN